MTELVVIQVRPPSQEGALAQFTQNSHLTQCGAISSGNMCFKTVLSVAESKLISRYCTHSCLVPTERFDLKKSLYSRLRCVILHDSNCFFFLTKRKDLALSLALLCYFSLWNLQRTWLSVREWNARWQPGKAVAETHCDAAEMITHSLFSALVWCWGRSVWHIQEFKAKYSQDRHFLKINLFSIFLRLRYSRRSLWCCVLYDAFPSFIQCGI